MFRFLKKKIDYLDKLIENLESIGYEPVDQDLSEIIPEDIFKESNFSSLSMINKSIGKQIEILTTTKNTIASFIIMDLNHTNPDHQYCNPHLTTTLSRISSEKFNHFEVFGFKEFGKKQFKNVIRLINVNLIYLTTDANLPKGNIDIYPGLTDLCNVKENLNQVMFEHNYELIQDSSKFNPTITKPEFWYKKDDLIIKFTRRKTRDENYIYAVKNDDGIGNNIFHYGTYEAGKQFSESEWEIIKEKLRTALDMML